MSVRAIAGWIVPAAMFVLWWLASHYEWMPAQILPTPALVWQAAVDLATQDLFINLWISVRRLLLGLAGGIAAGLVLGVLMGTSRSARQIVYPTFFALIQIPTLAWLPMFMILFGIGEALKLAVIVKAVIVPVAMHTLAGIDDAQPKLREVAAALRLPWLVRLRTLIIPGSLPAFSAGLRLALAQAWVSLLAVELLASSEGIGYLMVWGRQLFMLDIVFVCIVIIGLAGLIMDRGIQTLDSALIRWPRAATAEVTTKHPKDHVRLLPWLLPAILLCVWQWASASGVADPNLLPSPSAVIAQLRAGFLDGTLLNALGNSFARALAGLLLGGLVGVVMGLLLGMSRTMDRLLGPSLATLRQVAVFAWVPLITAWVGIGEPAKVTFVAIAAFFPMFVAAHHGVVNRSSQLDEAARALRLDAGMRLRVLILPGAAAAIFAGLQLGLTYAWLGAIGSEYFMRSGAGIGGLMINAQQLARMDIVIGAMVVIGLSGALLRKLGEVIETRSTRWRTAGLST
ncbi:MAG TPA: ABC transporter permease [Steroidobacter sp.]|uniref:ABC transporter permease n=1 Tax=Steroidobacter sp. TaxID=1978227 RepID=UPI002EDAA144